VSLPPVGLVTLAAEKPGAGGGAVAVRVVGAGHRRGRGELLRGVVGGSRSGHAGVPAAVGRTASACSSWTCPPCWLAFERVLAERSAVAGGERTAIAVDLRTDWAVPRPRGPGSPAPRRGSGRPGHLGRQLSSGRAEFARLRAAISQPHQSCSPDWAGRPRRPPRCGSRWRCPLNDAQRRLLGAAAQKYEAASYPCPSQRWELRYWWQPLDDCAVLEDVRVRRGISCPDSTSVSYAPPPGHVRVSPPLHPPMGAPAPVTAPARVPGTPTGHVDHS